MTSKYEEEWEAAAYPKFDQWADFRTNNGEFRQWLHVWGYINLKDRMQPWAPLPWVSKAPLSGEMLTAMYHIGMTKRWPGDWSRWNPSLTKPGSFKRWSGHVYGIILPRHNDMCLRQHLVSLNRQCVSDTDFKVRIRRYILFKQERVNADT